MAIQSRRYKLLADFEPVYRFLQETYDPNGSLLPQTFEYAHTHPNFNHKLTHRFGLWEDGDILAGKARAGRVDYRERTGQTRIAASERLQAENHRPGENLRL
jgi:hypothetical protein